MLQPPVSAAFSLLPRRSQQSPFCPHTSFNDLFLLPCVVLPTPSPLHPGNLSQINYLHPSPDLNWAFWEPHINYLTPAALTLYTRFRGDMHQESFLEKDIFPAAEKDSSFSG